jgi:hypothetical protein
MGVGVGRGFVNFANEAEKFRLLRLKTMAQNGAVKGAAPVLKDSSLDGVDYSCCGDSRK